MLHRAECIPKRSRRLTVMWLSLLAVTISLISAPRTTLARATFEEATGELTVVDRHIDDDIRWTSWRSEQHALADDGDTLWIGGAGGIIRYDKLEQTYTRYTPHQGWQHHEIYAIAVDGDGNRWFGGNAGLGRLDADEKWQHFTPENSGIYEHLVDDIAVGDDGTIWVSHGVDQGSVSRLTRDGTWSWFPSRVAAVASDYERILNTRNVTRLWTVAGKDVWVDLSVYTPSGWVERGPGYVRAATGDSEKTAEIRGTAADSRGNVYVLSTVDTLSRWDGAAWTNVPTNTDINFSGEINKLIVDLSDRVWVGWYDRPMPYSNEAPAFTEAGEGNTGGDDLPSPRPIMAMLATDEGLWISGPNWLRTPDGAIVGISDMPAFAQVTDLFHDAAGRLWVYSTYSAPYSVGRLQQLDDQGTFDLNDDRWTNKLWVPVLRARAVAPNGDLWVASSDGGRWDFPLPLSRYHAGQWIEYGPTDTSSRIYDIFVEDERHTWFVINGYNTMKNGVATLDDGGTPGNVNDDVWTAYPREVVGDGFVAVDNLDRLWFADGAGLHRYVEDEWRTIIEDDVSCGLVPTNNGATIYLRAGGTILCSASNMLVVILWPDGLQQPMNLSTFITEYYALVQQATRSVPYWSMAEDGSIWYQHDGYEEYVGDVQELRRFDGAETTVYRLQYGIAEGLSVDSNNHLWAQDGQRLLRMNHLPTFSVEISPSRTMIAPGSDVAAQVYVRPRGGFDEPVTLNLTHEPTGMKVEFTDNPVVPGSSSALHMSMDSMLPDKTVDLTVLGESGTLSSTATLHLVIYPEIFETFLPLTSTQ